MDNSAERKLLSIAIRLTEDVVVLLTLAALESFGDLLLRTFG